MEILSAIATDAESAERVPTDAQRAMLAEAKAAQAVRITASKR